MEDYNPFYKTLFSGILVYKQTKILSKKFTVETTKNPFQPRGIAIHNSLLYVCDYKNGCVVVLEKENGTYRTAWGTRGRAEGQFYYPRSIFIWEEIWYVADFYGVQLFSGAGACLQRIEEWGDEKFDTIFGICALQGYLCISDAGNQRIQFFRRVI